jgi:ABC-type transporter Mla subunit MlaD
MAAQPGQVAADGDGASDPASDELRGLIQEAHVALAARDAEIGQLLRERAHILDELNRMRHTRVWRLASRWWEWRAWLRRT